MNLRSLLAVLSISLLAAAPLAHAQDAAPAAAPSPDAPKAPKTALEKDMDKVNKAFRALRKQIDDASQNDSSIALLGTIHDAATAAANETPAWTSEQTDKDKFVADYKAKMNDFIADVDKVVAALKAGDNAGAKTLLMALGKDERADHKEFRKPEEKKD